ncbi:hypothetical protein DL93DRAFT_1567056 [Clavulina sp. PMI_390]|nr:hypothetical protein DL93DRAFT_1567056 [Clavulina sp. PMI_390]
MSDCKLLEYPDELLLEILNHLAPSDLLVVTVTCQRLRSIALDDILWVKHCAQILLICPGDNFSVADSRNIEAILATWDAASCMQLYHGLRRWVPYLGWWMPHSDYVSAPMQVNTRAGLIVFSWLDVIQSITETAELEVLPGTSLMLFHWGSHLVLGDHGSARSPMITLHNAFLEGQAESPYPWSKRLPQNVMLYPPEARFWNEWEPDRLRRKDIPVRLYPSPSLLPSLRGASLDERGNLLCSAMMTRAYEGPHAPIPYLPILSPSSPMWSRSPRNPIDAGIYTAPYGAHGSEILAVTFRTLTEQDFRWQRSPESSSIDETGISWPWDCHLSADDPDMHFGPFSRMGTEEPRLKCGEILASDLIPGRQIMEVTKLSGDMNVPRGQRSVVVFLDIPRDEVCSADMRRRNQIITEYGDGPDEGLSNNPYVMLPQKSPRPFVAPWPIHLDPHISRSHPARIMTTPETMAPEAGWIAHGMGHISDHGYHSPSWSPTVVHFASREEFQVLWLEMVMTFTRLNN